MVTGLNRVSKVYRWLGVLSILLGLFLLIGSIAAAIHGDRISSEPIFGAYFLSGGLFMLFAGYVGQAIDDIRNCQKK